MIRAKQILMFTYFIKLLSADTQVSILPVHNHHFAIIMLNLKLSHEANHSRYGPFPQWASLYGPHGGRYGPPR